MQVAEAADLSKSPDAVRKKLASGFDPNTKDPFGDTILHWALRGGSVGTKEVVDVLLASSRLKIGVTNHKGGTLLGAAVLGGKVDAAKTLLARGAKLSKKENPFYYVAHTQCGRGSYEAAKLVLDDQPLDAERARVVIERATEEGDTRLIRLVGGTPPPRKAKKSPATIAKPKTKTKPPPALEIDRKKLKTGKAREAALDAIGTWIVAALLAAGADDKKARDVMTRAIRAFYDVRESGGQERGEYAGHFFMVDAVGLDDSDRPVPWETLAKKASPKDLARWEKLFEALASKVR
jgi:hypothetical protein